MSVLGQLAAVVGLLEGQTLPAIRRARNIAEAARVVAVVAALLWRRVASVAVQVLKDAMTVPRERARQVGVEAAKEARPLGALATPPVVLLVLSAQRTRRSPT